MKGALYPYMDYCLRALPSLDGKGQLELQWKVPAFMPRRVRGQSLGLQRS